MLLCHGLKLQTLAESNNSEAEMLLCHGLKLQTLAAEIVTALAEDGLILTECAHGIA